MMRAALSLCLVPLVACTHTPAPGQAEPLQAIEPLEGPGPEPELAPTGKGDDYVFVWLKTGPATSLGAEEQKAAFDGHFANMARLAEERFLLLAGPVGNPKADPLYRGIFLFDVMDVSDALALGESDPSVQAGVFVLDLLRLRCEQPLRDLFELVAQYPDDPSGMRSYVIAVTDQPERAQAALQPFQEEGLVPLSGRLGTDPSDSGLFVLALESVEEAGELLALLEDSESLNWQLSSLYATKALLDLAP